MQTFEITVGRRTGDGWPVVVEQASEGTSLRSRREGTLRLGPEARAALSAAALQPKTYGTILGEALFRDSVRDAFVAALAAASAAGAEPADERLRVLLTVEDPELRALRWERLCVRFSGGWDHLALHQRVPYSLYLPSSTDRRFPPIGRRDLRAIVVVACPAGQPPFDVGATVAAARAALGDRIPTDVLAAVDGDGPPTLDALAECLTAGGHTLLHLVCHGAVRDGETAIFLEQADGAVDPVTDARFVARLAQLRRPPYFAFLSTCESAAAAEAAFGGLAQRLVRELGMPAVVAMTDRVTVTTAGILSATFYARLREHGEPDRALVEATAGMAERGDVLVPALFSRLAGRPVFDTAPRDLDQLTGAEIGDGLDRLEAELPRRAPVLVERVAALSAALRPILGTDPAALAAEARQARTMALHEVNTICLDALERWFAALALGEAPPPYDDRQPFRGLHSFRPEDRAFFFGRDELVARLRQKLASHPFLPVLGPSGSGKSSLVLAGLIPALEREEPGLRWADFKPGGAPLAALAGALARLPERGGVLVADQFEEAFTLCRDAKERAGFFDRLLAEREGRRVVLTMRADFWGECAPYPGLREAMQAHQELVPPMDAAALRAAIEQQAAKVGLRFEAGLAATILGNVQGEPGAMPLLQHALLEVWKQRHGVWLRAAAYEQLGGVQGAIAATADAVWKDLTATEQEQVRDIFVRLTRLDDAAGPEAESRDTRRRVPLADLVPEGGDPEATKALVHRLASAGLVVVS